jgi:hypothetical protein
MTLAFWTNTFQIDRFIFLKKLKWVSLPPSTQHSTWWFTSQDITQVDKKIQQKCQLYPIVFSLCPEIAHVRSVATTFSYVDDVLWAYVFRRRLPHWCKKGWTPKECCSRQGVFPSFSSAHTKPLIKSSHTAAVFHKLKYFEHLHWCSVCDPAKIFLTSKFSYLPFSNPTHKTKTWTANRWETTNSNPHGPIKLSSQLTKGVRLCCAFYQPQQTVQTFCAKLYS